jgi:tRNA (cytidine56-2'-O)-methyltransferase
MIKVTVLRWGHRIPRDRRITTHVGLVARAFGAEALIISDTIDEDVVNSIRKVVEVWGGPFKVESGRPWRKAVEEWRKKGGITVHLTVYGEPLTPKLLDKIKRENKPILVIVGSQKVPKDFFSEKISDYNVAVGSQPHSEVSSLAIFLDRILEAKWLKKEFKNAKLKIIPQPRGKKVLKVKS